MKKIIFVYLVYLLIPYFVIESFFHLFYPQSGYSVTYAPYGWKHIPNTTVNFYGEESKLSFDLKHRPKPIKIYYNWDGLRSPDWEMLNKDFYFCDKKYTKFRIMVIGDSWAEDMGSIEDNLHTTYLRKKLQWEYETKLILYSIINAGHYGFDNGQEYLWWEWEGWKYKPDIIILFYAQDTASPEFIQNTTEGLILYSKIYTIPQKIYRDIASFIRLHSQFGSWTLNKISEIKSVNTFFINKGYKEKPVPVVNGKTVNPTEDDFADVDKRIWLMFKGGIAAHGGKFIMMNCMGNFNKKQEKFLRDNNILHFGITEKDVGNPEKLREEDKANGIYDIDLESHRFGYKANEKVASRIIQFLKEKELLP